MRNMLKQNSPPWAHGPKSKSCPDSGSPASMRWRSKAISQIIGRRPEGAPLDSLSRPVAQKQSARPITGRPRSITARDDQPSLFELRLGEPAFGAIADKN